MSAFETSDIINYPLISRASFEYVNVLDAGEDGCPNWMARKVCNFITAVDVSLSFVTNSSIYQTEEFANNMKSIFFGFILIQMIM